MSDPERILFTFAVPGEVVDKATQILEELGVYVDGVGLGLMPVIRVNYDAKTGETSEAIEVAGFAQLGHEYDIVEALAKAGVAGYSRETQVVFWGDIDPSTSDVNPGI